MTVESEMSVTGSVPARATASIERSARSLGRRFPHYTEAGRWVTTVDGSWTGGLWVGQLLAAYGLTGQGFYADGARALLPALEARIDREDADFDLGFLLYPSFVRASIVFDEPRMAEVALRGAERMLGMVEVPAGLIAIRYPDRSASRDLRSSIIDIMANLVLLWWAATVSGSRWLVSNTPSGLPAAGRECDQ